MKASINNIFLISFLLGISFIVSFFLKKADDLLDGEKLITYIGIMIGFAITIYTFGISIFTQIKDLIYKNKEIGDAKKDEFLKDITDAFSELKEDVYAISYSLIFAIILILVDSTGAELIFQLPLISEYNFAINVILALKLFTFAFSTLAFLDLIKSMLSVSNILLYLIQKEKK